MRNRISRPMTFAAGLAVGLATSAVATLAAGAFRRRGALRREEKRALADDLVVIDGVRELDPFVAAALPHLDLSSAGHLASEAVDVSPESQRW